MPDYVAMTSNIAGQQPPAVGGTPEAQRLGVHVGTPGDAGDTNTGVAPGDAHTAKASVEIPADTAPGGTDSGTGGAPGNASPPPTTRKWTPLVTVCLGAFMLLVDVSIVNVALPKMTEDLHSSFTSLQWVVDMYALVLASLLMIAGSLGDRFGHRRLYIGGLVLFALASLACGLAPNVAVLITARGVQGVGAAGMFTATTALLSAAYQGRDRGTAFGVWGAVNGGAAALGPILGGLLTEQFGWRSIFLVNLPVAAVAVYMSRRVLGDSPHRGQRKIDVPGAVAFTASAASVTYALIQSNTDGWSSATVLGLFAFAAVALIAFVIIELRTKDPLLDLSLLRNPSFASLMAAGMLLSAGAFAHLTYTSIWLQSFLGMSPIKAGLAVSPLALTSFMVAGFGGKHLSKLAPQWPIGIGLAFIGGGTLTLMIVHGGSSWPALVPGLLIAGVGVGMCTPVLTSATMSTVPHQRAGMAGGALNTFRQLGYALGIAILGTVFAHETGGATSQSGSTAGSAATSGLSGGGSGSGSAAASATAAADAARNAVATGLDHVFAVAGGTALAGAVVVLLFVRRSANKAW
jgi:EmrB/QacA subfamily drug resistance transporter